MEQNTDDPPRCGAATRCRRCTTEVKRRKSFNSCQTNCCGCSCGHYRSIRLDHMEKRRDRVFLADSYLGLRRIVRNLFFSIPTNPSQVRLKVNLEHYLWGGLFSGFFPRLCCLFGVSLPSYL